MPLLNQRYTPEEEAEALKWYRVRAVVKEQFNLRPDINAMLFIIGMNEVGQVRDHWEKEEKQELMHVATCKLLSYEGIYRFLQTDEEGWPHYVPVSSVPPVPLKDQDKLLKKLIVRYFEEQELI